MSSLAKAVSRLAEARAIEAHEKEALAAVEAVVQEKYGDALAKAKGCLFDAGAARALADAAVRSLAVADADGDGEGHPGAPVVETTILGYAISDAIDYCLKHLPKALSLKKRDFEKVAKVLELDFVTIRKEPTVRIKRDLSAWLPGGEGDDATTT